MRRFVPSMAGGLLVALVLRVFMAGPWLLFLIPVVVACALRAAVMWRGFPPWAPTAGLLLCLPLLPGAVLLHLRVLAKGIPLPAEAEDKSVRVSLGDWTAPPFAQVTYRTGLPMTETAAFYRTELENRGWTRDHCFDISDRMLHTFLRGRSRYLISIRATPTQTRQVEVNRYYPGSVERMNEPECTPVKRVTIPLGITTTDTSKR